MLEHGAIIDGDIEKNPQGPLVSLIRIHYLQRCGRIATPSKWHSAAYSVGTDGVLATRYSSAFVVSKPNC